MDRSADAPRTRAAGHTIQIEIESFVYDGCARNVGAGYAKAEDGDRLKNIKSAHVMQLLKNRDARMHEDII
ncbi:hypothetical protein XI06_14485 [Bradyrhizobium sp. CCBAU 11434]|nr:hypothetical protein [Bradyrhizobium sp. CCBAU 11434]